MIAKFPGKCSYCGKPTKAGIDTYDTTIKKAYHQICHDQRPVDLFAANNAEQLARELLFIGPDDPIPDIWFRMSVLPPATGTDAGRDDDQARGDSDSLWPMQAGR
jgi:hypothetical protein